MSRPRAASARGASRRSRADWDATAHWTGRRRRRRGISQPAHRCSMDPMSQAEALARESLRESKCVRQELAQGITPLGGFVVDAADDQRIRSELVDHLPAGTAGCGWYGARRV